MKQISTFDSTKRTETMNDLSLPQKKISTSLMTEAGELVEVINGTLICLNTTRNWVTISDWLVAFTSIEVSVKIGERDGSDSIFIDFPESVPTSTVMSLLEHFEHQK